MSYNGHGEICLRKVRETDFFWNMNSLSLMLSEMYSSQMTHYAEKYPTDLISGNWKYTLTVFLIFIMLCKPENSSVIVWPFNNENVLAIHLECLHNATSAKSACRKKNSKKSKEIKATDFLTKYWDVKLREKVISSENDCTAGLDQRTCQQYFLVTISDYRKGAILAERSRVENARKKEENWSFLLQGKQLLISIKAVGLAEQHANTYYRESVNTNDLCLFGFSCFSSSWLKRNTQQLS